ncbi:MAG: PEP-CTERM sorting domain-containing protein [Phycisphaerales bacterium]|nr:PEP-CTERM sorting domain-containing protein [Phycisphaerales bacterium]
MKRISCMAIALVAALLLVPATNAAVPIYDFESGAQGWFSFGTPTTDSGNELGGSAGTLLGRYHTGDFDLGGWGMGDASPTGVDLSSYTGLSIDMYYDVPPDLQGAQVPFNGTWETELMIAIGYAEWSTSFPLTNSYDTYSVDFVDLTPNYYANIAPYFGGLPNLNDPGLKIQLITRSSIGTGTGRLHYDQISGIVPEPASLALLGLGAFALIQRRR